MPTTPASSRSPLQFAAIAVTVAVAFFTRLELVVPFLLAWAIWGLMQRSSVPERRWISAPFAASAASLIWYCVGGLLLMGLSVGVMEIFILGLPVVCLFFRPGKAPLVLEFAVQSFFGCWVIRSLIEVIQQPGLQAPGLRGVIAGLYFCVVTIGTSILALRHQPDVPVAGEVVG
jgi:hypothetical protein